MKYLLKKNGLYYRPDGRGYTQFAFRAGLFDEKYAEDHASCTGGEVQAVPVEQLNTYEIADLKEVMENGKAVLEAYKEAEQAV